MWRPSWISIELIVPIAFLGSFIFDTEVFKGPRFADNKTLDVESHYKPTETFQYTHFSSSHPLSVKKGFIKEETSRLLRTLENISAEVKFNKEKSLKDLLVRAKIPSHI